MNLYHFRKASIEHSALVLEWLRSSHMRTAWQMTAAQEKDFRAFIAMHTEEAEGKKGASEGRASSNEALSYWIGSQGEQPFCLILVTELDREQAHLSDLQHQYLSPKGHTISIEYGIGNMDFLGKGLLKPSLEAFFSFYIKTVDPKVDTVCVTPNASRPEVSRAYMQLGFEDKGSFIRPEKHGVPGSHLCSLDGPLRLLVKNLNR